MMIGYVAFWVLFVAAVAAAVILWRNPSAAKKRPFPLLLASVALVVSIILIISGYIDLRQELSMMKWPVVEGVIISSEVAGERAFHPEVAYSYNVDGLAYTGSSALNSPGFGGKRNRLEQAEILTTHYPEGTPVPVYYNPTDPAVSVLITGITYNTYLQLTLGAILFVGVLIWGVFLMRQR